MLQKQELLSKSCYMSLHAVNIIYLRHNVFDPATYDKLMSEAPKFKLITPILSDRLRINGSLARKGIRDLMAKGTIRMVSIHSSQQMATHN
ncbi:unnamed protein product [Arabis nemorensis]|uniref:40S ribosomal protein S25 n=1 Tax=Arabis nemorensis TaxID=586526 RepID=A0A565BDP0_9BRAS|nr:unnamed protein product [Arabis nemorensis]